VQGTLTTGKETVTPDTPHGVALEVLERHHELEHVRSPLGHARLDTTQVHTMIRPPPG